MTKIHNYYERCTNECHRITDKMTIQKMKAAGVPKERAELQRWKQK
jgi:hypothetical protein